MNETGQDKSSYTDTAIWAPVDPVRTGLSGRCPRCGEGRLFKGFLTLGEGCGNCRLDYSFLMPVTDLPSLSS